MSTLASYIKKIPALVAIFLVRCYQVVLSPHMPGCCRYEPTCSNYSLQAFQKYGFIKGLKLSVSRIVRCRPGGGHGYDPLP